MIVVPSGAIESFGLFHKQLVVEQVDFGGRKKLLGQAREWRVQTVVPKNGVMLPEPDVAVKLPVAVFWRIAMVERAWELNVVLDSRL